MAENNNSNEALREALAEARRFVFASAQCSDRDLLVDDGVHAPYVLTPQETLAKIDAALALPRRQCDYGSAEEQDERFRDFCPKYTHGGSSMDCAGCECGNTACFECSFVWGQLPYDKQPINGNNEEQSK